MPDLLSEIATLPDDAYVSGTLGTCRKCGARYIGRKGAIYCSPRCRMAASRATERQSD